MALGPQLFDPGQDAHHLEPRDPGTVGWSEPPGSWTLGLPALL